MIRAVTSEKAVKMIEMDYTLLFETSRNEDKESIAKEVEGLFKVKVDKVRTLIKLNKKYAYVKLNKANPAIDVATKLGMI